MRPDRDLWQILHAGDWACAHGDEESLARTCIHLAPRLEGRLGQVARHVATLAILDLPAATTLWAELAGMLRQELSQVDPSRSA